MINLNSYKNIIFDLGNVLVSIDPARCKRAVEALGMGRLLDFGHCAEGKQLVDALGVGTVSTEEFCDKARQMTGIDATNEQIADAANAILIEMPDRKKETLLRLRADGHRVFLLSNTIDMHWDYCVANLFPYQREGEERVYGVDDYFERTFLSQRMHLAKPDERIYKEVLRQAGIEAKDTIFIDDLAENCEAAERLGIDTFQNKAFDDWMEKTT